MWGPSLSALRGRKRSHRRRAWRRPWRRWRQAASETGDRATRRENLEKRTEIIYLCYWHSRERGGECKLVSDIYHGDLIITCLCVPPVPQVWPISDFFAPRVQMSLGRRWRGRRGGGDRSDPDEPGQPGDGRTAEGWGDEEAAQGGQGGRALDPGRGRGRLPRPRRLLGSQRALLWTLAARWMGDTALKWWTGDYEDHQWTLKWSGEWFESPLQDVTLHRSRRLSLGCLMVKQTLMQKSWMLDKRGNSGSRGNMSPVIRAGAGTGGWQTSRNTGFRFLFRADLNTWNDNC